jgi:tetratricopeptide (TPR) repeat protein
MHVTKNRSGVVMVALLAVGIFLAACAPPGPRALLAGKKLLEDGKAGAAIEELQTATALMPTNAAAWNYLGVAYHRAGQWTNAVEAYSRALRFNRELLEVRFNLGCLWLEQNKLDEAKAEFTAYTLRRPNAEDGWLKLGATQLRARDPAAEKSFREALRVNATEVEALNGLGLVFAQRNKSREAVDAFTAALKMQPDYRPALLNLATVLQQLQDRAGALQRYREYLALQPRDEDWEAVNAIVRSLEPTPVASVRLPPTNHVVTTPVTTNISRPLVAAPVRPVTQPKPETQSNLVRATAPPVVRVTSNPPPPAAEVVKLPPEPVIKTTPDDKPLVVRTTAPPVAVASSAITTTKVATAAPVAPPERKSFLSKLNPFKNDPKPMAESVIVTPDASETRLEQAASSDGRYTYISPVAPKPGDRKAAEQALALGQQAQRAQRLSEAIQFYRRATQLDGSYFEAHYSLGLATFAARSFKAATAAWETAIAIRPDSSDARYNFALTLKAAGHMPEAADELEKLLALHPDEARGHLTLGNLYAEQLADKPRARRHYQRVLQLDPRNPQAQAIRYWLVANPG